MKISDIVKLLQDNNLYVESNINDHKIDRLAYDSREVNSANTLFFCKGIKFEKKYIKEAIDKGVTCFISETNYNFSTDYIIVNDIRLAMALVSSKYYGDAHKDINKIAITGTKGKTTTTYFIKNILDEFVGGKTGVISTVECYTGIRQEDAHLTTPEAPLLHELFSEVKESGLKYLTMEATSQAYKTKRVDGIKFNHGIFLNIEEDHISEVEHSDFQDYFNCKLELVKNSEKMIINYDLPEFNVISNECKKYNVPYVTFGKNNSSDYIYYDELKISDGFSFVVENKEKNIKETFKITMAGRFNIENAVAALVQAIELGVPIEDIKVGLYKTKVSGRVSVFEKEGITVIVDYAHNKPSFTKLYESIALDYNGKNIISVGGAPGGKSYNRRREFAEIVGINSNHIILTAEDPQFESVKDICDDIIKYLPKNTSYEVIEDRTKAVVETIQKAQKDDVIILLAKSEEDYQKIEGKFTYYESDLKIAQRLLGFIKD